MAGPMRIIFMGTPDFAVTALDALVEAGHNIAAIYTQPPRPSGRGKKPHPSPVQRRAEALGLAVRTPATLRDKAEQADFAALNADIAVVAAYGLILPQTLLDAPLHGCLNIHASLLPRWRGAAPIQRAIMAGDRQTGVCIMQMEAGLDTGPVLARETTEILDADTAGSLHDRLAAIGAGLITSALTDITALTPQPQSGAGVTYATKISKAEARIDWSQPSATVDAQIRGLSPFPGAWTKIAGERVKILLSSQAEGNGAPGEAFDNYLTIACGSDAIRLLRLQRAGRGPITADEFLRGFPVAVGDRLA